MSEVKRMVQFLFEELELAVNTSKNLILKIKEDQWSYRPRENMRTVEELVHHIVAIPLADLTCLMLEKGEKEYQLVEEAMANINDPKKLTQYVDKNVQSLREYVLSLSDEDLMNKVTKPFYLEQDGHVQIKWLMEITTHLFHHRAQLFNYLKQLDHDLNMFDLYE